MELGLRPVGDRAALNGLLGSDHPRTKLVRTTTHDTLAWRQHLLTGLSHLVGAQVGMAAEVAEGGLRRQELACDRNWYRSRVFTDHYRPARINHYLPSLLHVPGYEAMHYVFLFKEQSERPFDDRERQLVHHLTLRGC